MIPFELPQNCKKKLQATIFAMATSSHDKLVWTGSKHGDFDLKSAYMLATNLGPPQPFHGNQVWALKTLLRIQIFLWKCCHSSIDVKECLVARGMTMETTCPLCHGNIESIGHTLRDCLIIVPIWNALGSQSSNGQFFSLNLHTWLAINCTKNKGSA